MNRRNIRVYVAGPIQGRTGLLGSLANLEQGQKETARLFQLGFSPFPVFCDFAFVQKVRPVPAIEDVYAYSLQWLKASHVMYVMAGWEHSVGCKAEIELAKQLAIPVVFDINELCAWADSLGGVDKVLSLSDD